MKINSLSNLFIPAQNHESKKLLIIMHGLGDSLEGYSWAPDIFNFANLNYLMLNAPTPYYDGYSWYEVRDGWLKDETLTPEEKTAVKNSRHKLFALIEELITLDFKEDEIAWFGFSQGCVMSLEVALKNQRVFAGFCGMSGYLFNRGQSLNELNPSAFKQNILLTHGTYDDLIPVSRAREDAQMLKDKGLKVNYQEFPKTHTIDPMDELPLIKDWLKEVLEL
ncbi:MAG: hypothetical protein SFU25_03930 [Candidatus Caenarcaniphilales bacterium]|nr:hypothetical protein [Candidatus Caenarcaniphilales bacterium]